MGNEGENSETALINAFVYKADDRGSALRS